MATWECQNSSTFYVVAILVGLTASRSGARERSLSQPGEAALTAPLEPLRPGVTEDKVFAELLAHNELRKRSPARLHRPQDLSSG